MISDIFRQTKHTLQDGDSSQEFYSFRLHSRGHLFLSVTPDRQLAVQQSDTPVDPQAPDDRCFVMHSVSNGSVFIQPYHHKGMLFCLIPSQSLNWSSSLHPIPLCIFSSYVSYRRYIFWCQCIRVLGYYLHHLDKTLTVSKLEINWRPPEEYFFSVGVVDVPDPEVFLPREDVPVKKPSPFIEESSPVKPSLLWGCFGGKSKKFSSKIKKTIKHTSRV